MASQGSFLSDPGFWVAASGATFLGLVWWKGGFKAVGSLLDNKIAGIKSDIEEAAKLRAEAEALLAKYQKRQREADKTAAEIIDAAKAEAASLMAQAELDIAEMVNRRTATAADRIAQAELNAVREVKSVAASVAIEAAEAVLRDTLKGAKGAPLVEEAISDIETRLH